jgi:hypothetical protein
MSAGRRRRPLAVVTSPDDARACESCGDDGPLALQQVGDDPAARFLLCASCGGFAVDSGIARWVS